MTHDIRAGVAPRTLRSRSRWFPYGVAIGTATIALLLTQTLWSLLNPLVFTLFYGAVAVSAWFGGIKPGLVTIALSTVYSLYFLIEPIGSLKIVSVKQLVQLLAFWLVSFLITSLCSQLQAAKRKAEANLTLFRESEQRFGHLSESNLIGIITADLNGTLIEANDAFLQMIGYTQEELRSGRIQWRSITPSSLEVRGQSMQTLEPLTIVAPFETTYRRKDGTHVPALAGSTRVGQATVVSFVLDISDRKQAETALLDARTRLEQHNTELAVTNEELETTLEELRIAEEELQRQNEQLKTERQRYQDLFNLAPDSYLVTDVTGVIQEANQAATAQLSIEASTLLGQPLLNFIASADLTLFRDQLNHLTAQQRVEEQWVQSWIMQLQTRHHKVFPAEITVGCVYDSTGNVSSLRWLMRDITERRQAEMKLRESESLYRAIGETLNYGIWVCDPTGRNLYASESFLQLVGITQEQCSEFGWSDVLHPDDADRTIAAWQDCVRTEGNWDIEHRFRGVDGSWHPILARGVSVRNERGDIIYWAGINLDISRQKRVEAALRQSEERYRYLVESIPQLVWTANAEGILTDVNQRWVDFTGLTLAQVQVEGWEAIVHPDDVPILTDRWLAAQQSGTYYRAEGRLRRTDRSYRWYLHQAIPLKNDQGQVVKWFGTATDIDDQKRLAQRRDRTLQQEQAAREAAEQSNRMKDEFLAVLSHELRSPLNPILGWSRLLQMRTLDEAQTTEALKVIERNARLQAELIEDLLDISRIMRGKLSLNVTPVPLSPIIQAAIETVRLAAEAKAIALSFEIGRSVDAWEGGSVDAWEGGSVDAWEGGSVDQSSTHPPIHPARERGSVDQSSTHPPIHPARERGSVDQSSTHPPIHPVPFLVSGDANRLQQIVWNLLSNAVKFTPTEGRVDVRLEQQDAQAQITIADTGKGIAPDFLPYVFDYFRQAEATTTRKFGGLGLGLAIVRQLVELHGGTVWADSPGEGLGATFTVKLPLLKDDKAIEAGNESSRLPLDDAPLHRIRILVVDDDADARTFIAFLLEQYGATVMAVTSANEALTALSQFQPDVLLSDIGMPTVDGYMLLRQVRTLSPEQGGQVPAIALTAYAGEINYQQALAAGFQRHLPKPVEPEALVAMIVSLTQGSQA